MKSNPVVQEIISFGTDMRRYLQLLGALFRREEEIRRHAPLESILNLLEPVLLIGMIEAARHLTERVPETSPLGGNPALFYITGVVPHYFFVYLSRGMGGPIRSSSRRFSVERRLDHIIVNVIIRIIDYGLLTLFAFSLLYILVTTQAFPSDFSPVIEAWLAMAAFGTSWGIISVVLSRMFWPFAYFTGPFNRALSIFSGVYFLVDTLSPNVRYYLSFNPMLHIIALFRQGFYPFYHSLLLSKAYLLGSILFFLMFALVFERVTRRTEG